MLDVSVIPLLIQVPPTVMVGNTGSVTVIVADADPPQLLTVSKAVLGVPPCHKTLMLDVPCPVTIVPSVFDNVQL